MSPEDTLQHFQLTGDPKDALALARILATGGNEVKKDCKKAAFFLFFCAKKDRECIKEIARFYKEGICVKKDMKKYGKYMDLYTSSSN